MEKTEPGTLGREVRQGCPLSPLLFDTYTEELIREAVENIEDGVMGGKRIRDVRFADYQAIMANTNHRLQKLMDSLSAASKDYGMKINLKKTKAIKIRHGGEMKIIIDGVEIEQVEEFCYLGSWLDINAKCHKEIRRRIAMRKEAFTNRRELLMVPVKFGDGSLAHDRLEGFAA